ncbi:hypothetical protein [uncultured Bacteroides sp.]|uniref:hypothetical protein n=1 Tax=uncultured Bacteroides sp. TaxID=162156 RepID=UPI002AABEA0C|nr:hypothetical protein [uncultured Bacteroides sp.]
MENQTSKIIFFKSRSLAGRFSAAFDFIENNLKVLVKLSSFVLLPLAVLVSLLYTMFSNLAMQVHQVKSITPEIKKYLVLIFVIALICAIGNILFKGIIYTLVKEYPLRESISRLSFKDIKSKIVLNSKRFFIVNLVLLGLIIVYFALFAALLFLSRWTLILTVPLLFFIMIPFTYAQEIYLFEDIKVMAAVKKGFKLGIPNWAGTFFLLILAGIFALIIQAIAFTPWGVGSFVQSLSYSSILDGNTSTLPGYFSALMFVLCVIAYFITYLAQLLPSVSMMFQYFSATQKRVEEENELNQPL